MSPVCCAITWPLVAPVEVFKYSPFASFGRETVGFGAFSNAVIAFVGQKQSLIIDDQLRFHALFLLLKQANALAD